MARASRRNAARPVIDDIILGECECAAEPDAALAGLHCCASGVRRGTKYSAEDGGMRCAFPRYGLAMPGAA